MGTRRPSAFAIGLAAAIGAAMLAGCENGDRRPAIDPPNGTQAQNAEPVPTYSDVVETVNANADRLDQLRASVVITVRRPDPEDPDELVQDQAEGTFQLDRPSNVALSVRRLGETFFWLGSDADRYWWLDLRDKDDKYALVGRHDLATPEIAGDLGLPVHPLELLDLMGLTGLPPVDTTTVGPPREGNVAWGDDRQTVVVDVPSRWGTRRVTLEGGSLLPIRVELLDEAGAVILSSELSEHEFVRERRGGIGPKLASRASVMNPAENTRISIKLFNAEGREPTAAAFDLPRLVRANRIAADQVYDLDSRVGEAGE
ncbi:MAG: hypothetical protein AAF747_05235 [Planctomycetota bacterium]